jgi:hypothetical protein
MDQGASKQQKLISHIPRGWEIQDQGVIGFRSDKDQFSGPYYVHSW